MSVEEGRVAGEEGQGVEGCSCRQRRVKKKDPRRHTVEQESQNRTHLVLPSSEIDYAAALATARDASATDLVKWLQKSRSTRSRTPISPTLSQKHFSLEILDAASLSSEQRKPSLLALRNEHEVDVPQLDPRLETRLEAQGAVRRPIALRAIIRPPAKEGAEIAAFAMFRFDTEPCAEGVRWRGRARRGRGGVSVRDPGEGAESEDGLGRELMM